MVWGAPVGLLGAGRVGVPAHSPPPCKQFWSSAALPKEGKGGRPDLGCSPPLALPPGARVSCPLGLSFVICEEGLTMLLPCLSQ